MAGPAAQYDRLRHRPGAAQPRLQVAELGVVLGHVLEHVFRLVELAFALEIERQVVQVVHHAVVHRHLAELVPGHIELALALKREPEHAVGFGRVGVGLDFARLGENETLGHEQDVADHEQHQRQHQLQPHRRRRHEHEVDDQEQRKQRRGNHRAHAGLEPRQQPDQVRGNEQEQRKLDPVAPGRRDEEMLGQDRRHRMRKHQNRWHCGGHRRDGRAAQAGRGRPDQNDFVLIFAHRDLAADDVVERIHRERGTPVAILVEVSVHARKRIGDDAELAQRHRFAGLNFDIAHAEIETSGRDHHRQRRINLAEVTQHQWLDTRAAVDIGCGIEMAKCGGSLAQNFDRIVDFARGHDRVSRAFADLGQAVLRCILRQRFVWLSKRRTELEQHHRHHVARARETFGQPAVGIECLLCLLQQPEELRKFAGRGYSHRLDRPGRRRRVDRRGRGRGGARTRANQIEQFGDVDVARVGLRLGEQHGVRDDLRLRRRQAIGQFCQYLA